jgi:hypothetical protein
MLCDERRSRFGKEAAEPGTWEDKCCILRMPQKRLSQCITEEPCGRAVGGFVHDRNCERIPEAPAYLSGLMMPVEPLRNREFIRLRGASKPECHAAAQERQPVRGGEQPRPENTAGKMHWRREQRNAELNEAAFGMVKRECRSWLDVDEVTCAHAFEERESLCVAGDEKMLSVIDFDACGRIDIRACAAAECGALFEKVDGNAGTGEMNGRSKSAQSAADDYDRVASARFHTGPRFNQEYFSLWLSQ